MQRFQQPRQESLQPVCRHYFSSLLSAMFLGFWILFILRATIPRVGQVSSLSFNLGSVFELPVFCSAVEFFQSLSPFLSPPALRVFLGLFYISISIYTYSVYILRAQLLLVGLSDLLFSIAPPCGKLDPTNTDRFLFCLQTAMLASIPVAELSGLSSGFDAERSIHMLPAPTAYHSPHFSFCLEWDTSLCFEAFRGVVRGNSRHTYVHNSMHTYTHA